ncbi:MAG: glycoside hydrolase family 9 protein [Bacteroidota bacterium]
MHKWLLSLLLAFQFQVTKAQLPPNIKKAPYVRLNQIGYLPDEYKSAIVFGEKPIKERFVLIDASNNESISLLKPKKIDTPNWGRFNYYYILDFSSLKRRGTFFLKSKKSGSISATFNISDSAYAQTEEQLLEFMRQQRCGYNPFLDIVCHQKDGRVLGGGPLPDSTYIDVSGGWHDAGDQLKYLITGSYATAHMLLAYTLFPYTFGDKVNELGQPNANGVSDILDEAKWGLDWIHKLHPESNQLFHQVADDRDHKGWKMPDNDNSDYGWGSNSYRVVYFATGSPQGLQKYKSEATGVANLAGRSAAAMALGARIWETSVKDTIYANKCLKAAKSLYALGKSKEGFQQGNSYGAPYRYTEKTWADDMEWAAAELFKITKEDIYLNDAKRYARLAANDSWMALDSAAHYQYYPFINMGHFSLYELVEADFQDSLAAYYKAGIEKNYQRAQTNPFGIGIPFIWCSNNLLTGLITQIILYERMTGDQHYQQFMAMQRDWLFGRNPWGTSMFTAMPQDGEYPAAVHTSIRALTGKEVPGGLVDGPVYAKIYQSLKGLSLLEADEFEHLQNTYVVYHDDVGDYSTNEPTMDGTAGAILMMAHWGIKENSH